MVLMSLKLIKLKKEDIFMVMKWRMLPEVTKYMYTEPELTEKSQLEWFNKISQSNECKYWIIQYNEKKIGLFNLYDIDKINRRCFWAYYIADTSFRGKGIGRNLECNIYNYVFYKLSLNKLCCEVLEDNDIVVKIHQKYGSKIEGKFMKHIFKNNKFHNVIRMGILREEWDKIKTNYDYEEIVIE
jgi:UDP-4-amino-4,6-dideoxy-N-acetyl-beta-L-altrosamine N-acetyltransferase